MRGCGCCGPLRNYVDEDTPHGGSGECAGALPDLAAGFLSMERRLCKDGPTPPENRE